MWFEVAGNALWKNQENTRSSLDAEPLQPLTYGWACLVPAETEKCGHCGRSTTASDSVGALVPDSSVIHPHDPSGDGHRFVTACCDEHLDRVVEQLRSAWTEEQLWFGRLCRASADPRLRNASLLRVGKRAHLSTANLRRALEWNANREGSLGKLPGGHSVPTTGRPE